MKYKVGDRVRIKSVDWYNKNKDEEGYVKGALFDESRVKFCGTTQTIDYASALDNGTIIYAFVSFYEFIGEEAIEGIVGEEKVVLNGKDVMKALKQTELPADSIKVLDLPDEYLKNIEV